MKNFLTFLSLLVIAGCDKYKDPVSLSEQPPNEPDEPAVNATVRGQVSIDGVGLSNVSVAISNKGFYITKTNHIGYYTFAGLGAGDYVVFLTNPNKDLYRFESASKTVSVKTSQDFEVNFVGIYIGVALPPDDPMPQPPKETKAIITGVVYEDINGNGRYDSGENIFPGVTVGISGREIRSTVTGLNGKYIFYNLLIGSYEVTAYGFESKWTQAVDILDDNSTVFYVDFRAVKE